MGLARCHDDCTNFMPNESKCRKCGAPLTPDAPERGCPKFCWRWFWPGIRGRILGRRRPSPPIITEGPGMIIGRYKSETIGEGGFGGVYMAEQEESVRRRVALKIIKLGMDTRRSSPASRRSGRCWRSMDHPTHGQGLRRGDGVGAGHKLGGARAEQIGVELSCRDCLISPH